MNFKKILIALAALLFVVKTGSALAGTVTLVAPPGVTLPAYLALPNAGNVATDVNGLITITQCVANTGPSPSPESSCDFGGKDMQALIRAGYSVVQTVDITTPVGVASLPTCAGTMIGAYGTVNNNVNPIPVATGSIGPTPKATASAGVTAAVHCTQAGWVVLGW